MRRVMLLGLLFVLGVPSPVFAGWRAHFIDKSQDTKATHVQFKYENGKFRIDSNDRSLILTPSTGAFIVLWHQKQRYVSGDIEQLRKTRDSQLPEAVRDKIERRKPSVPQITKTGKTQTVRSFTCEVITYQLDDRQGEVCMAKNVGVDLGPAVSELEALTRKASDQLRVAISFAGFGLGLTGFPLWVRETTKAKNNPGIHLEFDRLETATLPVADFSIPNGYAQGDLKSLSP